MPSTSMGVVRPAFGFVLALGVLAACASTEATEETAEKPEPPRIPNPPPKYKHIDVDAAAPLPGDGGSELTIRCGGAKPFVCPLEDGTFVCSAHPCVPDCSKIGCVGGEVCAPCDGGHRCVGPGGC